MITKLKLFEAKLGRPKTKWVKCIKDYNGVLNDDHVKVNPHLEYNVRNVYPFYEKGKMYKMHGPLETINGDYIVYISTNIKHSIGPPDYEKFISNVFTLDRKKSGKFFSSSDNHFEDYFEMPEETKQLIEWYYMRKDAKKYNI